MINGKNFRIDGGRLEIFDLPAEQLPDGTWEIGFTSCEGVYVFNETEQPTVIVDLMGRLDKMGDSASAVIISASVAARLWLDGVIKEEHFKLATEDEGVGEVSEVIILPNVRLGNIETLVKIISDARGSNYIKMIA